VSISEVAESMFMTTALTEFAMAELQPHIIGEPRSEAEAQRVTGGPNGRLKWKKN